MIIYLLIPLIIFYFLFLSRIIVLNKCAVVSIERRYFARNNITLFFWFAILLIIAIFKGIQVGTDYPMYYSFYQSGSFSIVEIGIRYIYEIALKFNNFLIFSFFVYFLILLFLFGGIKRNTPYYLISILFLILTYVYFTAFNQLRQMLAASIIFCFAHYLVGKKKDKFKFIIVILVALLFHNSAIFLFLLYFIPTKKKFNSKIVMILFGISIILYFIPQFKDFVGRFLISISGTYSEKYSNRLDYFFIINKEKGILELIPVIIQMIIVLISLYLPIKQNNLINEKLYILSTNLIIINLCLYSLSGIEAIDRIQVYFSCFNIYFYSIFSNVLLKNEKKIKFQIMVIFIILFWVSYYILRLTKNTQGIVPYNFLGF